MVEGIEVVVAEDRDGEPIVELNVTSDRVDFAGFVFSREEAADLGAQLIGTAFKAGLQRARRDLGEATRKGK